MVCSARVRKHPIDLVLLTKIIRSMTGTILPVGYSLSGQCLRCRAKGDRRQLPVLTRRLIAGGLTGFRRAQMAGCYLVTLSTAAISILSPNEQPIPNHSRPGPSLPILFGVSSSLPYLLCRGGNVFPNGLSLQSLDKTVTLKPALSPRWISQSRQKYRALALEPTSDSDCRGRSDIRQSIYRCSQSVSPVTI